MYEKTLILIMLILILVLSACGERLNSIDEEHDLEVGHAKQLPNGDVQEATASADVLPSFWMTNQKICASSTKWRQPQRTSLPICRVIAAVEKSPDMATT